MKIRLTLALLFVLGIGTSVYCTYKAPATNTPSALCCSGDPGICPTCGPHQK